MSEELHVTTERVDDFVVLLAMLQQMGLPTLVDRHLPRHWKEQGLSWGWVTSIWLAHIVSQGDHRKLTVRDWVNQAQATIQAMTGLTLRPTDFTDDRLAIVLRHLSATERWHAIEADLGQRLIRVYALAGSTLRTDATTFSGYHAGGEGSLWQFGHSKDDPNLRQVKAMVTSLDPLGLPLVVDVVSGEHADDPLYLPAIDRAVSIVQRTGLLIVGDCKMSALATRAHLAQAKQYYLTPLALTGETAALVATWIAEAPPTLTPIWQDDALMAEGYERLRECHEGETSWSERLLIVRSPAYDQQQCQDLEARLERAQTALLALTPAPGRGKRQISDEAILRAKVQSIGQRFEVADLLDYQAEAQITQTERFMGRGRGSDTRPRQTIEHIRWQIHTVTRNESAIAAAKRLLGWRVYATNAPSEHLSFELAIREYRQEYRIERNFARFKGAPLSIAPLFVKRDDQVQGLIRLLSLALRLMILMEGVVRRRLQQEHQGLIGLHAENPKKATATPTTERLLQAFASMTLARVTLAGQWRYHITPLSPLQRQILRLLDLPEDLYDALPAKISLLTPVLRE